MGQYWIAVSLDRKEPIQPNKLGTGSKLGEILSNHTGVSSAFMTKRELVRKRNLMPGGIPRWVRCYDDGGMDVEGGSIDRYTVVFTGRYAAKYGSHVYLAMNGSPYHPQGFCQHGETPVPCDTRHRIWPPAIGRKCHLGIRIPFSGLPEDCRKVAIEDYLDLWDLRGKIAGGLR